MTQITGEPPPETIETLEEARARQATRRGGRIVSASTVEARKEAHKAFLEQFGRDVKRLREHGQTPTVAPIGDS